MEEEFIYQLYNKSIFVVRNVEENIQTVLLSALALIPLGANLPFDAFHEGGFRIGRRKFFSVNCLSIKLRAGDGCPC